MPEEKAYAVGGDVVALIIIDTDDDREFTRFLRKAGYQYREIKGSLDSVSGLSITASERIVGEYMDSEGFRW